jgi:hypothetical protein
VQVPSKAVQVQTLDLSKMLLLSSAVLTGLAFVRAIQQLFPLLLSQCCTANQLYC